MKVQLLLFLFNSFLGLIICLPIVSLFYGLGQWLAAAIWKVNIKEISLGFGSIIYIRRSLVIRSIPLWFWIRWDSNELRKTFLTKPQAKNYVQIMFPKQNNKYYFEDLGFCKKILLLSSGILSNFIVFWLVFLGMYYAKFHFDLAIFFRSFFTKSFGWFYLWSEGSLVLLRARRINFVYSFLMVSCFSMFIHLLPLNFLDGQKILAVFWRKITKKSINEIAISIFCVIGMFLFIWMSFGFLMTWQV